MRDLKETATQLVNDAHSEVLARYTEAQIEEHIENIKIVLEMSEGFDASVTYTLEQMLENLEFAKSDLLTENPPMNPSKEGRVFPSAMEALDWVFKNDARCRSGKRYSIQVYCDQPLTFEVKEQQA